MKDELLLKYIKNEASSDEKEQVIKWIGKTLKNQKRYNILKARYVADTLKNVRRETDYDYYPFMKTKSIGYKKKRIAYAAAASIALLVGAFILYKYQAPYLQSLLGKETFKNSKTTQTIVQDIPKRLLELPDGSTVLLNEKSNITYPKAFADSIREVTLVGEAFFDIVHRAGTPFVVHTKDFNVRVLGTSFNVKSYPDDSQTETTLVTGKVEVLRTEEPSVFLSPSQKAIFNKENKKIEIEEVSLTDAIAWKNGKLIFNKTPLEQVVIDIERKYDVDISIDAPEILDYKYTGAFDNLSIDEALGLLMISSPIKYKKENNKIVLYMK